MLLGLMALVSAATSLEGTAARSAVNPSIKAEIIGFREGVINNFAIQSPYRLRVAWRNTSDQVASVDTCARDVEISHFIINRTAARNIGERVSFAVSRADKGQMSNACQSIVLKPGQAELVDFYFHSNVAPPTNGNRITVNSSAGAFVFVSNQLLAQR